MNKNTLLPLQGQLSNTMFLVEHPDAKFYPCRGSLYAITRIDKSIWKQQEDGSWFNVDTLSKVGRA